jgi:D-alanine--poly(phosphoribitol) ligase subunit 2
MSVAQKNIADALEQFIRDQFHVTDDDPDFSRQVHLYEYGYVDSIGATEVLNFVETTFGIKIPDALLFSEQAACIDGFAHITAGLIAKS